MINSVTVNDIKPGRIHVRDGKGGKERFVPLSTLMYRKLQAYWLHHKNPTWIFLSAGRGHPTNAKFRMGQSDTPFGKGALQLAFHNALKASTITKKATIHTLPLTSNLKFTFHQNPSPPAPPRDKNPEQKQIPNSPPRATAFAPSLLDPAHAGVR